MEKNIENKSMTGFGNSVSTKKHEKETKDKEDKRTRAKTEGSNAFRTPKKETK